MIDSEAFQDLLGSRQRVKALESEKQDGLRLVSFNRDRISIGRACACGAFFFYRVRGL